MSGDEYERIAWTYEAVIDRLNAPLHRSIRNHHPPPRGARILDIGCGTGAQLSGYADGGATLAGIDLSRAMLDRARRRLGSDVDLRHGSATDLPFDDGSFDQVLASLVLHEMRPDVRVSVMEEARRVLAPGGRMVVAEFGVGPMTLLGRLVRAVSWPIERLAGAEHFRSFRQFVRSGGFPDLAARTGFTLTEWRGLSGGNLAVYEAAPTISA